MYLNLKKKKKETPNISSNDQITEEGGTGRKKKEINFQLASI